MRFGGMAPEKAQLSGQLGYKSGAHLKELHGVVASDLALQGGDRAADGALVRVPIHRDRRRHLAGPLLLHQGLEVQQVALVVHLVRQTGTGVTELFIIQIY